MGNCSVSLTKIGVSLYLLLMLFNFSSFSFAMNLGQSDQLKFNIDHVPEWPVNTILHSGTLVLSDSPEAVPDSGIMYEDTVVGDVRLFFHHVNATNEPKKIVVVLENPAKQPVHINLYQWGRSGPGLNYVEVGKGAQAAYMKGWDITMFEVPSYGVKLLDAGLDNLIVEPKMLVNGIYDFKTDHPVKVKVLMMPLELDATEFILKASVLPADQYHLRGTFNGKDRTLAAKKAYNPKKDGVVAITLADDTIDKYVEGIDATDGYKTQNYGNYGVVYKLYLPSEKTGKIAYYLTPLGGEYAGALGLKYSYIIKSPIENPSDKLSLAGDQTQDSSFIGIYEGGQSLWFTFSPPGASNLPVKLVFVPK